MPEDMPQPSTSLPTSLLAPTVTDHRLYRQVGCATGFRCLRPRKASLCWRRFLVSSANLSPLAAIPEGPKPVLSAGLWKKNIVIPKALILQQALWSRVPRLQLAERCSGVWHSVLFLPPSCHHQALWLCALDPDLHDTHRPGHFSSTR